MKSGSAFLDTSSTQPLYEDTNTLTDSQLSLLYQAFAESNDTELSDVLNTFFGLTGKTITVGHGKGYDFDNLEDAIAASNPGDTIKLSSGAYGTKSGDGWVIPHDLNIVGVGGVVKLVSNGFTNNALITTLAGADLTLANLVINGARAKQGDAAGVHHRGDNLAIINSSFSNNDSALVVDGSADGQVLIKNSQFTFNGSAVDGHALNIVQTGTFTLVDSHIQDTEFGTHVKSLASVTTILRTIIEDGDGNAQAHVSAGNADSLTITDSTFVKSTTSDWAVFIELLSGFPADDASARIASNTFINELSDTTVLVNKTDHTASLVENTLITSEDTLITLVDGPATTVDNTVQVGADGSAEPIGEQPEPDITAETPILDAPIELTVEVNGETVVSGTLNIQAALTDTDGSETLEIVIYGAPGGMIFSAGFADASGNWHLQSQDLDGLMFELPATILDDFSVDIVAVATETSSGATSSSPIQTIQFYVALPDPTPQPNTLWVGAGEDYASLSDALAASNAGDTIYITSGTYDIGEVIIRHDVTIIGMGDVVLTSSALVAKGLLVTTSGVNLEVQNLIFNSASSPDKNGAGIRHQGNNLTVIDSQFTNNENGILAGANASAVITITGSTFTSNGYGDGYSHGIYINHVAELLIDGSTFLGTKVGHHVKSLAEFTSITNSVLDDAGGTASYNVDVTRGGDLYIADSTLIQSSTSQNPAIVNYDISRGGTAGSVQLINNEIVNAYVNGTLLANRTDAVAELTGNTINDETGTLNLFTGQAIVSAGEETDNTTSEDVTAETPTLSTPSEIIINMDEDGVQGTLNINASLTDTDGSETLRLVISNLPDGVTLSAGIQEVDGKWYLSQDDLDGLMFDIPPTVVDSFTIQVTAESTESASGDVATKIGNIYFQVAQADTSDTGSTSPALGNGDITTFKITNTDNQSNDGDVMTFGQIFAQGDVPAGQTLIAKFNGQDYAIQMDVKATWEDGSVRHAVLTLETPNLASGASAELVLAHGAGASGAKLSASDILNSGYDVSVDVYVHNDDGSKTKVTINAADILSQSIANGSMETWIEGPLSSEYSISHTVNERLDVRFNIQIMADGDIRTDVIFANDDAFSNVIRDITYDVSIKDNGSEVFASSNIDHHRASNWHYEHWSGDDSAFHFQHDVAYLMATGAIPNYDTSIDVNQSKIDAQYEKLLQSDTGPLGSALVTQYMPMTGGREDIGLLPGWTSRYLLSQDEKSFAIMMANADAAGSASWHMIDAATGEAVSIYDHPDLWIDSRDNVIPSQFWESDDGGWKIDNSHQPSLSYVPYLITGNQYYLDNLVNQTSYSVGKTWDEKRGEDGNLIFGYNQPRGDAWLMRTLSETSFIIPDSHALNDYFSSLLNANLDHLVQKYVIDGHMDTAGELEGWFDFAYQGSPKGVVSAWQQDFISSSLALAAKRGFDQAETLLEWTMNYVAGRYTNDDNGFNPDYGSTYRTPGFDPDTGNPYSTWEDAFNAGYGETWFKEQDYEKTYYESYHIITKATLAGIISETGGADAVEAFGYIAAQTWNTKVYDPSASGSFNNNPTWNIAPKLSDGTLLTNDKMTFGFGTINGTSSSELLSGSDNNDVIQGYDGVDLLFGYDGADNLNGGSGNDYLYGGNGNDALRGGGGSDIMKGHQGADRFVFGEMDSSSDIVSDFTVGVDKIALTGTVASALGGSAASLLGNAQSVGADTLLDFGNSTTVTLIGVSPDELSLSDFLFI